jgi:hypothetical protein
MINEETNEAWKLLLESLSDRDQYILHIQRREIELLQKLMITEENVRELIKIIANMKFPKQEDTP